MPIELSRILSQLSPPNCVLFLGAGATVPSGAPSVATIVAHLAKKFNIDSNGLTLTEIATLIEQNVANRRDLIRELRQLFVALKPTGGLLNITLWPWRGIYTTNYDHLIEDCYLLRNLPTKVISSNFDFSQAETPAAQPIYKIHGTIEKDVVDGNQSRIILSEGDYQLTEEFREMLYDRLKSDLAGSRLLIIGHSLADPDIRDIVSRAIRINTSIHAQGMITVIVYQRDENRAALLEARGLSVVFSSVDEVFSEFTKHSQIRTPVPSVSQNALSAAPLLNGVTRNVMHALATEEPKIGTMFNGWPATYGDIKGNLTFARTLVSDLAGRVISRELQYVTIVGASGVGKTTASRQLLAKLSKSTENVWEHDCQKPLSPELWRSVAATLASDESFGVLFIDEASSHLPEINRLADALAADNNTALGLVLASARSSWAPRIKSSQLYRRGREHLLRKLDIGEIDRLLLLVDNNPTVSAVIENSFKGFSRAERRRRLVERCEQDFFVCMRNIFASEKFDDIILREYAALDSNNQSIYRLVAALQSAGVTVHRQLIIRLLNIPAQQVNSILAGLSDVVVERTVNSVEGIYGWIGRHPVISEIISRYKYGDQQDFYELLVKVIKGTAATYSIEVRSLRDLCSSDLGIRKISNTRQQNVLYRMMMSIVPGERVPRHRLIRNLIAQGDYDEASTEIRIFSNDFREDGPVARYRVDLMLARSQYSPGLLDEDRLAILHEAKDFSLNAVQRFPDNKHVLNAFGSVGVRWFKVTGEMKYFDDAVSALRLAEERIGDPEISSMINRLSRSITIEEE